MRIRLVTSGSRGDVQPFVALALGLAGEGHEVALVTHEHFRPLVEDHGLRLLPIAGDLNESAVVQKELRIFVEGANPLRLVQGCLRLYRLCKPITARLLSDAAEACHDAELIICGSNIFHVGETIAEAKGIPYILLAVQPATPSREYPNILFKALPSSIPSVVRHAFNWTSHYALLQIYWRLWQPMMNQFRREIFALPPLPFWPSVKQRFLQGPLILNAFSPELLAPTDWGDRNPVTGFIDIKSTSTWSPDRALCEFLDEGPPPLCITFGSMIDANPAELMTIVREALALSAQRAVVVTAWGALKEMQPSATTFVASEVPYDWLFPRVALAIHHGGAGTVGAALRAGVPSIVVPFIMDQLFWGRCLQALGLATAPLPRRELTAPALAQRIQQANGDARMPAQAQLVARRVQREDGISRALAAIDSYLQALGHQK